MHINFNEFTREDLLTLLDDCNITKHQRKIVVKKINDDFGLIDAVVYISTDKHPHYVKDINHNNELGLNLLYGDKTPSQKSKKSFYWVDYHGNQRKSFHKGGNPKIYICYNDIDRVAGRRVWNPLNINNYKDKNS